MSGRHQKGALAGAALLFMTLALGGCSTSIAEIPIGGNASDARTNEAGAYLPVNELPPAREEAVMDPAERAKVQKELIAAREHQASAAKEQAQGKDQGKDQGNGQGKDQSQTQNQAQAAK